MLSLLFSSVRTCGRVWVARCGSPISSKQLAPLTSGGGENKPRGVHVEGLPVPRDRTRRAGEQVMCSRPDKSRIIAQFGGLLGGRCASMAEASPDGWYRAGLGGQRAAAGGAGWRALDCQAPRDVRPGGAEGRKTQPLLSRRSQSSGGAYE